MSQNQQTALEVTEGTHRQRRCHLYLKWPLVRLILAFLQPFHRPALLRCKVMVSATRLQTASSLRLLHSSKQTRFQDLDLLRERYRLRKACNYRHHLQSKALIFTGHRCSNNTTRLNLQRIDYRLDLRQLLSSSNWAIRLRSRVRLVITSKRRISSEEHLTHRSLISNLLSIKEVNNSSHSRWIRQIRSMACRVNHTCNRKCQCIHMLKDLRLILSIPQRPRLPRLDLCVQRIHVW